MNYPLSSECPFTFSAPASGVSRLKAWRLELIKEDDSDERPSCQFPHDLGAGFAAIVWSGSADFASSSPLGCGGSAPHMVQLTASDIVTLSGDGDHADIAIVGVFDTAPSFDESRFVPSGRVDYAFGDATGSILAIFRVVNLDQPGMGVEADPWGRPAAILTTLDGPRPVDDKGVPHDFDSDLPNELQLVGCPADVPLSFEDGPKRNDDTRETVAVVCDYVAEGDVRIEDGCHWRCWSGGPIG